MAGALGREGHRVGHTSPEEDGLRDQGLYVGDARWRDVTRWRLGVRRSHSERATTGYTDVGRRGTAAVHDPEGTPVFPEQDRHGDGGMPLMGSPKRLHRRRAS